MRVLVFLRCSTGGVVRQKGRLRLLGTLTGCRQMPLERQGLFVPLHSGPVEGHGRGEVDEI